MNGSFNRFVVSDMQIKPISLPMVSGCKDLKQLGQSISGFYTVKSSSNNKLITVYCDFSKENQSKLIQGSLSTFAGSVVV
jgi:hypothetical protein